MSKLAWLAKYRVRRRWIVSPVVILFVVSVIVLNRNTLFPGGIGLEEDKTVSTSEEKNSQGNLTKTVTTTTQQSGKTLWDWLSVLGVPLSLAVLGFLFQHVQQKQAEANQREEALQSYFDRLSELLVDKNLFAIATKRDNATVAEKELLDSAVDVIRARTLSILRQFREDKERKTSVVQFLLEAEVISKLELNLNNANLRAANLNNAELFSTNFSGANLSGVSFFEANLSSANLSGANLNSAILNLVNFSNANLSGARLSSAELNFANLSLAKLIGVDLCGAKLVGVDLRDADLRGADLSSANLSDAQNWTKEQFSSTRLCKTVLPKGCNLKPDRDCGN